MAERIESINEITNFEDWYDGYQIVTSEQIIYILISNGQDCCEDWGYCMSHDDIQDFIGQPLLDIKIVDEDKKVISLVYSESAKDPYTGEYAGGAIFINLETPIGVLQFAVYNAHNGYYGHEVKVISKQVTVDKTL